MMLLGPGATCAMAKALANAASLIHAWLSTTCRRISGRMAFTPPIETSEINANVHAI